MSKFNIKDQLDSDDEIKINDESNVNETFNDNEYLILKKQSKGKLKAKPVQFYLNDELLNSINLLCKQTGQKRNDLVVNLLKFAISKTKIM